MSDDLKNEKPEKIGVKILRLLRTANMTQRDLAYEVGVTEVTLSRYIHGERTPKSLTLSKIAKVFGTTTDYLLGNTEADNFESKYYEIYSLISKNVKNMSAKQKKELVDLILFGNE